MPGMSDPPSSSEPFDLKRIAALPAVADLTYRRTVGSTQDLARDLALGADLPTPALVLAARQTAGRGRGRRRWWSASGSLTFSLVLEPERWGLSAQHGGRLSLATGLACCETIAEAVPSAECGIKWPNDVFLAGKKVCGILIETIGPAAGAPARAIVGVGLNANNSLSGAAPEVAASATSLQKERGRDCDMTDLLVGLLDRLWHELRLAAQNDPQQIARWQNVSLLTGRRVTIERSGKSFAGRVLGVDDHGALLLQAAGGEIEKHVTGTVRQVDPPIGRRAESPGE